MRSARRSGTVAIRSLPARMWPMATKCGTTSRTWRANAPLGQPGVGLVVAGAGGHHLHMLGR